MTSRTEHELEEAASLGLLAAAAVDPLEQLEQRDAVLRSRRRRRMAGGFGLFVVLLVLGALGAQAGFSDSARTGGTAPRVAVTAEASGIVLLRPERDTERLARSRPVAGGTTSTSAAHASYELPGIARVERASTDGRVRLGARSSASSASVETISLFDDRVRITGATMRAEAQIRNGRASGALTLNAEATLTVDGEERPLVANERIAVEGIGTVIVNEQAVLANAPTGDRQTGPRHRVVGAIAHVRITQQTGDLPVGSELVIGRVDAGVRQGKVRAVSHPDTTVPAQPATPAGLGTPFGIQAGQPKPGEQGLPRRSTTVRGAADGGGASASLQGYLFPVLGNSSFTNDWGGPRASTGIPHQGTDIFAAEGTPIVALADGVLDRVGWNAIGGYRFWLFDEFGNSFYHAHLSAFTPLAQDGARVRRGDVIGFVGHTGDAQFTPPHLHFEIHPGNGAPVNPFPYLNAWQKGVAVAIGLRGGAGVPERVAPLELLGFSDISANSGLADSVLDRVPDTRARPIEHEHSPRPTDETLTGAIEGPGIGG